MRQDFPRFHPDRAAGGDRHHRRPHRPAPAGGPGGPRGRPPFPVRQQPQADRPGGAQLRKHQQLLPALGTVPLAARQLGWAPAGHLAILQYIEQGIMFNAYNAGAVHPNASGNVLYDMNTTVFNVQLATLLCPSDRQEGEGLDLQLRRQRQRDIRPQRLQRHVRPEPDLVARGQSQPRCEHGRRRWRSRRSSTGRVIPPCSARS